MQPTRRTVAIKYRGHSDSVDVGLGDKVDPVPVASDDVLKPPSGQRWVAFPMQVTNTSGATMQLSSLCIKAVLSGGGHVSAKAVSPYGDSPSVRLRPGESTTADVVFDVPQSQSVTSVSIDCSLGSQRSADVSVR